MVTEELITTEALLDRPPLEAQIFTLNPNPTIHELKVGHSKHRVLIVDDFFLYPERILSLVDELVFFDDPKVTLAFPGRRAIAPADLRHLIPVLMQYTQKTKPISEEDLLLCIQGLWGNTPLLPRQRLPHTDPTVTALLYLNRPEDCSGGTGLYRHEPTGIELLPIKPDARMYALAQEMGYPIQQLSNQADYNQMTERMIFNPRFGNQDGSMLNQGNEWWTLMHLIEMKFNRLIIYDGRIPHTIYIEPGSFIQTPRFTQLFSFDLDKEGE